MSESWPLLSRSSGSPWWGAGMINTHQNSWHSRQRVMHAIIKKSAECWGSREEAKVNVRWEDSGRVRTWTDSELSVGKWMGIRKAELNERALPHGCIFLEQLPLWDMEAFQSLPSTFSKGIFPCAVLDPELRFWGIRVFTLLVGSFHFNKLYIYLFILFLAVLGLRCCPGVSLVVVCGLLIVVAFLLVEHGR